MSRFKLAVILVSLLVAAVLFVADHDDNAATGSPTASDKF